MSKSGKDRKIGVNMSSAVVICINLSSYTYIISMHIRLFATHNNTNYSLIEKWRMLTRNHKIKINYGRFSAKAKDKCMSHHTSINVIFVWQHFPRTVTLQIIE